MSETNGSEGVIRPLTEERKAAISAASFRETTKGFYPPITDADWARLVASGQDMFVQRVNLRIGDTMNARLNRHMNVRTGKVISEQVSLYKAGKRDETWGPKICDYVNDGTQITRFDAPNSEQRQMEAAAPPTEDTEEHAMSETIEGFKLEKAMGLNGVAVGAKEVDDLDNLFFSATPLPHDSHEK